MMLLLMLDTLQGLSHNMQPVAISNRDDDFLC
jgi:hypothetical protein